MARNGGNILSRMPDDFQHSRRMCSGVMQRKPLAGITPLTLVVVARRALVMIGGLPGLDWRQIINGVQYGQSGFEIQLRGKEVFLRNQHAGAVAMANG